MNKLELIKMISDHTSLSKMDTEKTINKFIEVIKSETKKGTKILISGLGSFEKIKRAARKGVNPSTGEKIQIKAKFVPKFKAAKAFKEFVL